MGMTVSEKIIAKAAGRHRVAPGEIVYVEPDITVCHELFVSTRYTGMLREIGVERICAPEKTAIIFDHRVPVPDLDFAERHKALRRFVREQGIRYFYDVGRSGIAHHFMAEKTHARPGILYAADDIHATCLGAMGCFAASFGLGIVEAFATGRFWLKVPATLQVRVTGEFQPGVMSRDLLQNLLGDLGSDGALYQVIEFTGPAIEAMSIDSRLTLCSNVCYAGAKTAIINPDKRVADYVRQRSDQPCELLISDIDARYHRTLSYDVTTLEPQVAAPHSPVNTKPVSAVAGIAIQQVFIGSCAGGHIEDMQLAAGILKGHKVNSDVRLIVIPTTPEVYLEMVRQGLAEIFIEAGAVIGPPSCGPCAGGHMGLLAAGEACMSTSTLNLRGRMGSPEAAIYLGNAATAAAAAIAGRIVDPREFL
jgi:3-isopropylmalate/(R)-2-methylmalate dehydratase large subunit